MKQAERYQLEDRGFQQIGTTKVWTTVGTKRTVKVCEAIPGQTGWSAKVFEKTLVAIPQRLSPVYAEVLVCRITAQTLGGLLWYALGTAADEDFWPAQEVVQVNA